MGLSNLPFQLTPGEVGSTEVIVKYSNESHESGDYGSHKRAVKVFLKCYRLQQLHCNTECVR